MTIGYIAGNLLSPLFSVIVICEMINVISLFSLTSSCTNKQKLNSKSNSCKTNFGIAENGSTLTIIGYVAGNLLLPLFSVIAPPVEKGSTNNWAHR